MSPTSQRAIAALPDPRVPGISGKEHLHPSDNETAAENSGFYPVIGLIGVAAGTVTAMAMVPSNPQKEGVLALSGALMCLGLLVAPAIAFFRNPRNILRTENIVGMAGVYWLFMDLVASMYDLPYVGQRAVRWAFLSTGIFVAAFWLGTMLKPWRLPKFFLRSCSFRAETTILLPIALVCFVIAMMAYAIPSRFDIGLMFRSLLENRWAAPWARGDLGGWRAIIDHFGYFGYLLPTLAVMIMRRKGLLHPSTLLAIAMAAVFLAFLLHSGSRRIVGVCLGSALACWMLDRPKIHLWQFLALMGATAAILWTMQFMLIFRGVGIGRLGFTTAATLALKSMVGESEAVGVPKGLAVDDNFYRLVQTISLVPDHHPFVYGEYAWYVLVRPIPRALWENKPTTGGFLLQEFDNVGASLSMSIVGEAWVSWGFPAVMLAGWFFGRLSRMNSPLFRSLPGSVGPMFYGYMTMLLFAGWRSLQEILLFSYALLGWIVVTWLYSKIRGRGFHES